MSIIKTIPKSSRFYQVDIDFLATFNNPTIGKYDWNISNNQEVVLIEPINRTSVYLIDRYSFSSSVPEGTFLSATSTIPTAQLRKKISGVPLYQRPIPCINYVDNAEALAYFSSPESSHEQGKQDKIVCDFRGVLNQTADLVGINEIRAHLSFSIYEITDESWLTIFRGGTKFEPQNEVVQ